jgi:hypothetical protein
MVSRAVFAGLLLLAGCGERAEDAAPSLIDELFALHPRPVSWRRHAACRKWTKPPPDDGPLDVLIDYWVSGPFRPPSEAVRERFLAAAEEDLSLVARLLEYLPETDDACRLIEKWHRQAKPPPGYTPEMWDWVPAMIRARASYKRAELAQVAVSASAADERVEALHDLAEVDWARAGPLAYEFAGSDDPLLQVTGLGLLYDHHESERERLRPRLRELVEDRQAGAHARQAAFDVLWEHEWQGRETWYLSLFEDASFADLCEDSTLYRPLRRPVWADPDRWIPVVARFVGSSSRAVHDNAVTCLAEFTEEHARVDSLRPLIPWVADASWADAYGRVDVIRSLEHVHLPEAVPSLIAAAESEEYGRWDAVAALGYYEGEQATAALRHLLGRIKWKRVVFEALARCGGVSIEEQVSALEAGVRGDDCVPELEPSEALAAAVIRRARELQESDPALAESLLREIYDWPLAVVDRERVRRIVTRTASLQCVRSALLRRKALAGDRRLRREADRGKGMERGIAAAIVGKADVLGADDAEAQRAFLACARWAGIRLPLAPVTALLATGARRAAERYLESDDRREAWRAVLAHHKGEAYVIGWHGGYIPTIEEELRKAVLDLEGPHEVYALTASGQYGQERYVVSVFADRVEITTTVNDVWLQDAGKHETRRLADDEWEAVRAFLHDNRVDDIPSTGCQAKDGIRYWYWHVRPDGGRRLFMDSPPSDWPHDVLYHLVVRRFQRLAGRR